MNTDLLREKSLAFVKENKLVVASGLVGLIFLGYGLISSLSSKPSADEIIFQPSENSASSTSQVNKIVVDIEGGVEKPGVYSLLANSRIQDALIAAGGLSESANREWVAQHINLAAKVTDGAKIYIPLEGEVLSGSSGTGIININTASEKELDSLPGIGLVTAQKIMSARPYGSLEELLNKKVISSKVFEQIKEKISL